MYLRPIESWLRMVINSQSPCPISLKVRTVDSKSINRGSIPLSGAKLKNINTNQFDLSKICVILYIVNKKIISTQCSWKIEMFVKIEPILY